MFESIKRGVTVFMLSQKYAWMSAFSYRLPFFVYLFYAALDPIFSLIFVGIIYSISNGIAGWNYFQLLALVGSATILYFGYTYFVNYSKLSDALRKGEIDVYLNKPYNTFTMMLVQYPNNYQLGGLVGGIALFAYAASNLSLGAIAILSYVVLMGAGVLVLMMFVLMLTALTYKQFGSGDWIDWLGGILFDVAKYPLTIYGFFGGLLLTFIIPVGLASYYPSAALLQQLSIANIIGLILLALAFVLITRKVFYFSMKHYASGGG